MASPLTPDDFKALIPNPNGGACDELRKSLLQFPQSFWTWYAYFYNADGTVSEAAAQDICAALSLIDCAGGGGTTGSSTSSGSSTSTTTPPATALVYAVCIGPSGGATPTRFIELDLATGNVTVIKTGVSTFYCLAEDPTSGILYGYVLNGANIDFVSIDKVTGTETVIGASVTFTYGPVGLTFDSSGTLYVTDQASPTTAATPGTLATVNLATGARTNVAATDLGAYLNDICFVGSTMYATGQLGSFTDARLFTVNVATGVSSQAAVIDPPQTATIRDCVLAYVNSILYQVQINTTGQINTATGVIVNVSTFDNTANGRITGMAKLQ